MPLRLGNQTVLVRGANSALLMDFSRGAMQRVSLGVADLLDDLEGAADPLSVSSDDSAARVLEALTGRGFVRRVSSSRARHYSADWTYPVGPTIRTLSFECSETTVVHLQRLLHLAQSWHDQYGLLNIMLFCDTAQVGVVRAAIELAAQQPSHLIFDVITPHSLGHSYEQAFAGLGERVSVVVAPHLAFPGRDDSQIPSISKTSFFCREDMFHLSKTAGESYGCIHINKSGDIFPGLYETCFKVGTLDELKSLTLGELLDRSSPYWAITKDKRGKCKDCEFRLACPNPLSARSVSEDLHSPPRNCTYSPELGAWA